MIARDGARFFLTIPLGDALSFALGMSDLHYDNPRDELRQIVGLIAVDSLQYTEQWRAAGLARACLKRTWPSLDW
jgi:hypothetical protein